MKKLVFILTMLSGLFGYQVCETYLINNSSYRIVCLNGDEFLVFSESRKGGITKTGHKCECIYHKQYIGSDFEVKRVRQ